MQLIWRDRAGRKLETIGQPQERIQMPDLSADAGRVTVQAWEDNNQNPDIWVHDVARGFKSRITFHPALDERPVWGPNGDKITFSSFRNGNSDIFVKSADGTGDAEELLATPSFEAPFDWSPDGKYLIYDKAGGWPNRSAALTRSREERRGSSRMNIWYLRPKEGAGGYEEVPFVNTAFDELAPDLSPDGRFLAYESDESGRYEVYVRPFPEGGGREQVSTKGGRQPRWRGDGKELFYGEGDTLMADFRHHHSHLFRRCCNAAV